MTIIKAALILTITALASQAQAYTIHFGGDSITCGVGASSPSTSYPQLLAGLLPGSPTVDNFCVSGGTVFDIGPAAYSKTPAADDISVVMIGVNDASNIYPTKLTRDYYQSGLAAMTAWLSLDDRQTLVTSGTYTGTWTVSSIFGIGKSSFHAGDSAIFQVNGTTAYVGILQFNGADGVFDVYIDGIFKGNYTNSAPGLSAYPSGYSYGERLLRFPGLTAGQHAVKIVVAAGGGAAFIDWVAGNGGLNLPVYVSNIPITSAGYATRDAHVVHQYDKAILETIRDLRQDGLPIYFVDNSKLKAATDISPDGIHPLDPGYARIAQNFYNVIKGK